MTPTVATILASADKAALRHAQALEAHQATHEHYARERASQQAATPDPGPVPYGPGR